MHTKKTTIALNVKKILQKRKHLYTPFLFSGCRPFCLQNLYEASLHAGLLCC
jgi:hypothetical protein